MKNKIWVKFVIIYVLFGFVAVFTIAAMLPEMTDRAVEHDRAERLYREATIIATDYMEDYEGARSDITRLKRDLDSLSSYLECSIWLLDEEGKVLLAVGDSYTGPAPDTVEAFNAGGFGQNQYMIGDFYGVFDKSVLSVGAPLVAQLKTMGYVVVHSSLENLKSLRFEILKSAYITFAIVLILSSSLLIAYFYLVQRPMNRVIAAATHYAQGELDYQIPIESKDEMGYLSASLNHMASRLNASEDEQKKFIANVSHDFRSPLTSIKGYSEAIADGTIPPELAPKYLHRIVFETERLTDLTADLLTLSKLDSKEAKLEYSEFDVVDVIKRTANSFEDRCREKNIEIVLLLAEAETMIRADRPKIQQVFYNLIDNAIKFSHTDSTVTVETTRQMGRLLVSVRDEGIGIPEDEVEKIWKRFYKSDLSRGKDKKGTGLGLSIVHEILHAHGQNIICESTEGVGTEFMFTLPLGQNADRR